MLRINPISRAQRGTLQPRRGDRYVAQGKASPRATPWVTPSSKHLPFHGSGRGQGGGPYLHIHHAKKSMWEKVGNAGKSREEVGKLNSIREETAVLYRHFPPFGGLTVPARRGSARLSFRSRLPVPLGFLIPVFHVVKERTPPPAIGKRLQPLRRLLTPKTFGAGSIFTRDVLLVLSPTPQF